MRAFRHLNCQVRRYPAGPAPSAICLIVPSAAGGDFHASHEELEHYDALAKALAPLGIATMIIEMPAADPTAVGVDDLCERLRHVSAFFELAELEHPGKPKLVVGRAESARCAEALARCEHPSTVHFASMVLIDAHEVTPCGRVTTRINGLRHLIAAVGRSLCHIGQKEADQTPKSLAGGRTT